MELSKLINTLELEFPPNTAWENDSIGLQIKSCKSQIENVFVTLELNIEALEEAIDNSADLIITFHPLIFSPLRQIDTDERVGQLVTEIIKSEINLFSIHTNFDSHPKGTSYELCTRMGYSPSEYLVPYNNDSNYGMGVIIELENSITLSELVQNVSNVCNSPIKYNLSSSDNINKFAILGGSGASYIDAALSSGCEAFVTADIKYHDFHRVDGKMALIDPGHYEMEQFVASAMYRILDEKIGKEVNLFQNTIRTNPVNYYPAGEFVIQQKKYLKNNKRL